MRDTLAATRRIASRCVDALVAFGIAAAVFAIAAGVSFNAIHSLPENLVPSAPSTAPGFWILLTGILGHNLPAAAFLYSGLATAGISSLIGVVLIGSFIGATTSGSAAGIGVAQSIGSVAGYAPIEFIGLLVAAAAGLLPIVRAIGRRRTRKASLVRSYVETLPRSLLLFSSSLVFLVVAAAVEALIIVARGG